MKSKNKIEDKLEVKKLELKELKDKYTKMTQLDITLGGNSLNEKILKLSGEIKALSWVLSSGTIHYVVR